MTVNSEAIFTKARELHQTADRIEVTYLVASDGYTVDDGFHAWDRVIDLYGSDIGPKCRVTEVAIVRFPNGAVRHVFGSDVTDAAEQAVWAAENAPVWDTPRMQRELGTVF